MLPRTEPDRAFTEPWHAELFAATHALARTGAFRWDEWAAHFGKALAAGQAAGAPDDGSAYYEIWLDSFEQFLTARGLAEHKDLSDIKDAWADAYLKTPHGMPVELKR